MATDTVLNELILQEVTHAEFEQLGKDNLLDENRIYLTPDNSLKGTLLDYKWADHLLNDMSWLRADTFSWQSGDVYVAAYNHLVADFEGAELKRYYAWVADSGHIYYSNIENVTDGRVAYMYNNGKFTFDPYIYFNVSDGAVSVGTVNVTRDASKDKDSIVNSNDDTFGDTTITYYRAEDGHKICLPDQEDKVLALYNATGVAWYYILDTANKQFKLPRSKHNKYADTLGVVGNGKTLGLTDGVSTFGIAGSNNALNAAGSYIARSGNDTLLNVGEQIAGWTGATANGKTIGVTTDPEKSGIVAQQEQDTDQYKYLYFYVGNFERDALEQTAGINAEMFNGKLDIQLGNASTTTKSTVVGWGIPDYSAGVVVASGIADYNERTYTAPADGVLAVYLAAFNGQDAYVKIDDVTVERVVGYGNAAWTMITGLYPVKKGSVVKFKDGYSYADLIGSKGVTFYPFMGVN